MFLPLAAVKLPLYPLHVESHQERLQQASAVAADGFNARPVLIDENAIVVDGAETYCALYNNGIDKIKFCWSVPRRRRSFARCAAPSACFRT